jgi:hypothetical protein
MAYPYVVQDLLYGIGSTIGDPTTYYGGVWEKLSNRDDVKPQWIADAVLALSQSYPFQALQRTTAAPVQMTTGQYQYPFSAFVNAGDVAAPFTNENPLMIPSFYMFYNVPIPGVPGYNPGIGLTYKTIDSLELMFSTPGTPAYWTRFSNNVFIAPQPNNTFYSYMRYQIRHPFPVPTGPTGITALLETVIQLPDEWREVIEYSAAMRGAGNLRMLDYATQYKNTLHGDPKKPGDIGIQTALVTAMENDIVSNQGLRQIRPMNGRM